MRCYGSSCLCARWRNAAHHPLTMFRQNYAKLAKLGHKSYASASSVEHLLKTIESESLPIAFSRRTQRRAVKSICDTDTRYGKLLHDLPMAWSSMQRRQDGDTLPRSPHYAEIVRRALEEWPCTPATPWNLILYQDGVDVRWAGQEPSSKERHLLLVDQRVWHESSTS